MGTMSFVSVEGDARRIAVGPRRVEVACCGETHKDKMIGRISTRVVPFNITPLSVSPDGIPLVVAVPRNSAPVTGCEGNSAGSPSRPTLFASIP